MKRKRVFLFLSLMFTLPACSPQGQTTSQLKESWDGPNRPENFGSGGLHYDQLKGEDDAFTYGKLKSQPWSDTYWPLYEAGFAHRWLNQKITPPFVLNSDVTLQNYAEDAAEEIDQAIIEAEHYEGKSWQETLYISPAEKYDIASGKDDFPLTRHELASFAVNRQEYQNTDWSWMGHCHGWAAASYLLEKPAQAVLMTNKDTQKQALFTAGDIRGLLTKAASDNGFEGNTDFIGTRCNTNTADIPRDGLNRIIDGAIGTYSGNGSLSNFRPIKIVLNNWINHTEMGVEGVDLVVKFGPQYAKSKNYWLEAIRWKDRSHEIVDFNLYSTKVVDGTIKKDLLISTYDSSEIGVQYDDAGNIVRDEGGNIIRDKERALAQWNEVAPYKSHTAPLSFKYYKSCRDLNAGTFHTVLNQYLSKGHSEATGQDPRSFVMDVTRDDQVWNHAIYSFESLIGEKTPLVLPSKDGTSEIRDPYKYWRTPGTTHIVDVITNVVYATEGKAQVWFEPSDELLNSKLFRYTLELDEAGNVIGGEWHGLVNDQVRTDGGLLEARSGFELLMDLRKVILSTNDYSQPNSPDFIWRNQEGSFVKDGELIKKDLVKKIHDCSINQTLETKAFEVEGQTYKYVECSY